ADDGITLIALDQPTVVPNSTGMRPVDRVAASLAGWLGGGVQPANRGRLGIFSSSSPIYARAAPGVTIAANRAAIAAAVTKGLNSFLMNPRSISTIASAAAQSDALGLRPV